MTTAHVSEYAAMTQQTGFSVGTGEEPALAEYDIDYSGGEAHGATLNAKTRFVRVFVDSAAKIKIDVTAVAANTSTGGKSMAANQTEYFGVSALSGTGRVSAITRS